MPAMPAPQMTTSAVCLLIRALDCNTGGHRSPHLGGTSLAYSGALRPERREKNADPRGRRAGHAASGYAAPRVHRAKAPAGRARPPAAPSAGGHRLPRRHRADPHHFERRPGEPPARAAAGAAGPGAATHRSPGSADDAYVAGGVRAIALAL